MVHLQRICVTKHVLVTGTLGAWVNQVANRLHNFGWAVLWPNQDIEMPNIRFYFEHDFQNYETQRIHEGICEDHGVSCLSDALPIYYPTPFPGPAEFIAKFDSPAVISGTTMSPFLDLWANITNVVVDIQTTEAEDESMVARWTKGELAPDYIKSICNCYRKRYNAHLKLFSKVFTMTNAEVKDRHFDKLDKFLTSI
jgi:hypothetical protein